MLLSCEDIAPYTSQMMAGHLVVFCAVSWIWGLRIGTSRGSTAVFVLFMSAFSLFVASTLLAALGSGLCRVCFAVACLSDVPLVVSLWVFIREHQKVCAMLESKKEKELTGKRATRRKKPVTRRAANRRVPKR